MKKSVLAALSGLVFLSACSSDGDVSNIFWRKATWESYMAGEDIKLACATDSQNQYRYFYNANRAKSVLMYNWQDGAELSFERLDRGADSETKIDWNILETLFDPEQSQQELSDKHQAHLAEQVQVDLKGSSIAINDSVTSAEHFLTVSTCVNSVFQLKLFSQTNLQEAFPKGLDYLLKLTTDQQTRPQLPKGLALTNRSNLIDQSDKDAFIHYRITLGEGELQFGEMYPFK